MSDLRERVRDEIVGWPVGDGYYGSTSSVEEADGLADAVIKVIAGSAMPGKTSDGHHTFDELYEYRMLYNAHAVKAWLFSGIPVVKSWRHSDGEECFGGGWFIVTAQLPTGQVSNHYKAEHWGLFECPSVEKAPTYDGHTPRVVADRLRAALGGEQA